MELKDEVKLLAEQCLPSNDFFLVDVRVSGKANSQKVVIVADGDNGISIDDCAEISRKLGEREDLDALFSGPFQLEITSPGADEIIKHPRQYTKNIGRRLEIVNIEDELVTGKLLEVTESGIVIIPELNKKKKNKPNTNNTESEGVNIPHNKIKKSNVIISFK